MAEKKNKRPAARTKQSPKSNQDVQAVRKLQEFYELGQEVLKADEKNPRRKQYSMGVVDEIASRVGTGHDYVYKARKFASSYTEREFKELCNLLRPDQTPLGPRHVVALLRVTDKRKRKGLQRRAAMEGWSVRQITAEVAKLLGKVESGGRQPELPKDADDALAQIIAMASRWIRWYVAFNAEELKGETAEGSRIGIDDLPESVGKILKRVLDQVRKLKKAIEQEQSHSE